MPSPTFGAGLERAPWGTRASAALPWGTKVERRGYAGLIVVLFDWLVERDGIDLIRL